MVGEVVNFKVYDSPKHHRVPITIGISLVLRNPPQLLHQLLAADIQQSII